MNRRRPYSGRRASLATRHGKQELIGPVMEAVLGLRVEPIDVDTDSLGTFSGEVPRHGTPRETVIAKARMGMASSGLSLGLANEGTIGSHPAMAFVVADVEVVCFLDDLRAAVVECALHDGSRVVRIESDFRAHHHPSRQQVIVRAADRLARRLVRLCPRCGTPGWGTARREAGAPCALCRCRTRQVLFEHCECPLCDYTESRDVSPPGGIDPSLCPRCNP